MHNSSTVSSLQFFLIEPMHTHYLGQVALPAVMKSNMDSSWEAPCLKEFETRMVLQHMLHELCEIALCQIFCAWLPQHLKHTCI